MCVKYIFVKCFCFLCARDIPVQYSTYNALQYMICRFDHRPLQILYITVVQETVNHIHVTWYYYTVHNKLWITYSTVYCVLCTVWYSVLQYDTDFPTMLRIWNLICHLSLVWIPCRVHTVILQYSMVLYYSNTVPVKCICRS